MFKMVKYSISGNTIFSGTNLMTTLSNCDKWLFVEGPLYWISYYRLENLFYTCYEIYSDKHHFYTSQETYGQPRSTIWQATRAGVNYFVIVIESN